MHDDDVVYLRNGDILYYDFKGNSFDPKQVVDQYERDVLLGEGGLGASIAVVTRKPAKWWH